MELKLNPDDLTLGDLEDFEDYTGKTIDEIVKPVPVVDDEGNRVFDDKGRPEMTMKVSSKSLVCLVWLMRRKDNPNFTIQDARQVKVTSLVITESSEGDQGNA
ncbi:hypothetical protein [Micromonospora andamanensis]|uniref:hypothetical protein n=1 Tax=Micromonospora andamanensis TaxID=1287068 RepID=UPI001950CBC7|nr:hypothetical protein [Micromonospora andamanensis]GIJ38521.1 hypothetical protein Vwe01_18460 [Micromonospora andamanensis]